MKPPIPRSKAAEHAAPSARKPPAGNPHARLAERAPATAPPLARLAALFRGEALLRSAFAISLAVHALVLATTFALPYQPDARERDRGLEVVLVNARHARAPEKADVLAQANLDAGGNSEKHARPKSPLPPQETHRDGDTLIDARKRTAAQTTARTEVLTAPKAAARTTASLPQPEQTAPEPKPSGLDLLDSVAAAARLEAEIDRRLDEYAKRPRKKVIFGARAKEYRFAQYVEDWRQKIERVGTLNYPEAARGRLYGSLLLYVAIRADGSIDQVRVERSSGEKVLDEAAVRIVNLAGPFAPFPNDIRTDTDIVEIVRTWTFTNTNKLTGSQ